MKTLIIVESPHKAQLIQGFLDDSYIVMASKGHITELAKGGKFGIGVDIENNFTPRYILSPDKVETLQDLMNAAKEVDLIVLASDPDREGEAIAWHLAKRLEDMGKPFKRAVFHEIKKTAVLKALNNMRDIDIDMFYSQQSRRILDRIVGFKASPFLMSFFGPKLSAGRVQSVVTRLIVDRDIEIKNHVPEEYWTIGVQLTDGETSFNTKYPYKISDKNTADDLKKRLSNKEYVVSNVVAAEEAKYPTAPLITSTLQRIMSKNHNMNVERTTTASQKVYETGFCTYVRTDSFRTDPEFLEETRQWLTDNNYKIPPKAIQYKNSDAAQDAHECIRPTDITLTPYNNMAIIDPDEKLVYEVIWKCFMASQMLPAVYNTLKVTAHVKNDKSAEVRTSGKALKSKGYLEILGINDTNSIDIPNLKVGDIVKLTDKKPVNVERKQTQPPPRYSEDKLIKTLVEKNIGRPSTYSNLISTVCTRNYVEQKGNVFYSTELGRKITEELIKHFTFLNYNYTAELEKKLDLIADKKVNSLDLLRDFYDAFAKEISSAYLLNGGKICPDCGNPMSEKTAKDGRKFIGCNNYPKCRKIINID